jgi:hypothetical protein
MMDWRRGHGTRRDQWYELHTFAILGAIRIAMFQFAGAIDAAKVNHGIKISQILQISATDFSVAARNPVLIIYILLISSLYLILLRRSTIPGFILDGLGCWLVANLVIHFVKINYLLLTDSSNPRLLMGQVVTYLLYFAFAWAWIFCRVDSLAIGQSPRVVGLEGMDPSVRVGWFDYYHTSFIALLKIVHSNAQGLNFVGVSKFGRTLVAIHSFMVFDLAGIALARFYQLVQQSI